MNKPHSLDISSDVGNPSVESPWTQWTLSMDIVRLEYWNEGPILKTMSTESMDNVH